MRALGIPAIVLICLFLGALLGICLRRWLPEGHLSGESTDVIKLATGLMATLAALVLSLLISSANNDHKVVTSEYEQGLANVVQLDQYLMQYGPETKEARDLIRRAAVQRFQAIWPDEDFGPKGPSVTSDAAINGVEQQLLRLSPRDDRQKWFLAQALPLVSAQARARWLLLNQQIGSALPMPLLIVLVAWSTIIFLSFGLLARPNPTVIASLLIAALAVSGAIFLILELNHPFHGLIQVPSAPAHAALDRLGK